jgi:chromosome segregation ATPase
LRAYRTEKERGNLIKGFEKVLGEHTPCTSIAETDSLVEYLQNLTKKNDMIGDELRRVSKEMADLIASSDESKRADDESKEKLKQENMTLVTEVDSLKAKIIELEQENGKISDQEVDNLKSQVENLLKSAALQTENEASIESLKLKLKDAEEVAESARKTTANLETQLSEVSKAKADHESKEKGLSEQLASTVSTLNSQHESAIESLK